MASCMIEKHYRQNTKQGRKFLHFPQVCHKHARNYKPNNIQLLLQYDLLLHKPFGGVNVIIQDQFMSSIFPSNASTLQLQLLLLA